nr:RNA-binding protein pno1-like [Ipomoea batatas]
MEIEKTTSDVTMDVVPANNVVSFPGKPNFKPLKAHEISDGQVQFRKVPVPPHRYTPLKKAWMEIYTPIYEQMKIDIRMNLKARRVELKTRPDTPDISNLQKCADFVHAFMLGFDVCDGVALLRLDELYVESFEIKDVKTLRGEHLSRAIGRLSGKGGKTKFAIENSTKTRIVIADTKIHILGSFANIKVARDSLCSLILGSPAGKVYSKLRAVTARLAERAPKPPNSYLALACYAHAHAQAMLDTCLGPQVLVSPTPSQSWPGSTFALLVHLPGLVSDQLLPHHQIHPWLWHMIVPQIIHDSLAMPAPFAHVHQVILCLELLIMLCFVSLVMLC